MQQSEICIKYTQKLNGIISLKRDEIVQIRWSTGCENFVSIYIVCIRRLLASEENRSDV